MASEDGTKFEHFVAKQLSGDLIPRSGGGVHRKMDVETSLWGEQFLFSCKSTEGDGVRVNTKLWDEVQNYARERDPNLIPTLALEIDSLDNSRQYVVLSLEDFKDLATASPSATIVSDKAHERREQAKLPPLLRQQQQL